MKHCQKCNLDFPVSYRFCGSCGGALPDSLSCQNCGEVVDSKWGFCTNCGKQLTAGTGGQVFLPDHEQTPDMPFLIAASPEPLPLQTIPLSEQLSRNVSLEEWYADADLFDETTATPLRRHDLEPKATIPTSRAAARPQSGNGKTFPTLTMLSAYGEAEKMPPTESQGRHALLVGLLLLVLFGFLGLGGWYFWTHRVSVAQSAPSDQTTIDTEAADSSSSASSTSTAMNTSTAKTAIVSADEEWKRLREKRISAKPSEASQIISSLEGAERRYPHDYRFPYERAKLSIKGFTSHHEAFDSLARAAAKAIDDGKAREMLDSLMADQDGDFWKLSRGHREWQVLVEALRTNDRAALKLHDH